MRFRLAEFEQHFTPAELQKGLHALKKKPPVLMARHNSHYSYQVGQNLVSFERSGPEVHHLHCDCQQKFCRHLAAVMFMQNENMLPVATRKVRALRSESQQEKDFRGVFSALEAAWKKITATPQTVSAQLAAFVRKLEGFAQKGGFAADMAVIAGMSLCGRSALTDERLSSLTHKIILRNFRGEAKPDEEVMYLCLVETLRSNDRALTGRFSSVLPVYLLHTRNMFHLEELRALIEKRHFRKYHSDLFDELFIARTMVFFRTSELEGKNIRLLRSSPPEYFVASARLLFAAHKIEEAWSVLDELRRMMREKMPLSYFDLLSYLIALCDALHDNNRKVEIAEEMMLCSPYLSGSFVDSYLKALPVARRTERVRQIMRRIAASGAEGAGDKLLVLAMESGQTDLFLHSHLRHRVRFTLLHELFARHRSLLEDGAADFYFTRLCEALTQTEFALARVQMLRLAASVLTQLPAKRAAQYHLRVLEFMAARPSLRIHLQVWENTLPSRAKQLVLQ